MNRAIVLILSAALALRAVCRQTDLGEGGRKVSGAAGPAGCRDAAKVSVGG